MADGNPQFSPVVGLRNRRICSGMGIQGQNVVVTFPEGRDWSEALIWDWRNDERNVVQSPRPAGKYWFMAASKTIATLWDLETRSIEVHLPSPSGGYAKVGSHHPISAASTEEVSGGADDHAIDIIPTFVDSWNSGTDLHRIALAHLEQETLRIDMEDLGAGRIGFTSYLKDNTYMEGVPTGPHGDESEVPANFFKTISDHLVDLSSSGRLTLYLSPEGGGEETECISYFVDRARVDDIHLDEHSSFICPFSGIVGSVSTGGNLFIWRLGQDACI
ncbi:hypothetical protein FRC04_002990 [Tulasnella sp. 424]|nr:hypothetical protein FRC04_002990 [Tulasnella sp. 424]